MKKEFEAIKHHGKWAVFGKSSRAIFFIGKGRKFCEKKAKELNEGK